MELARSKLKFLTAKRNFLFRCFKNKVFVGIKWLGYLDPFGYF